MEYNRCVFRKSNVSRFSIPISLPKNLIFESSCNLWFFLFLYISDSEKMKEGPLFLESMFHNMTSLHFDEIPPNRYTFTVHYLKNYLMTKLLSHSITLTFNNSLKYICKYLRYICNLWTIPASAYIWKNRDYEKLVIPYTGGYGLFHTVLTEDILQ